MGKKDFDWNCITSVDHLGENWHLYCVASSNKWTYNMFLDLSRSLISFISVISFFTYSCCTCFLRFLHKYFIFIILQLFQKGIFKMLVSLLHIAHVLKHSFCVLTLSSAALWILRGFFLYVDLGEFSIHTTSCHL